MSGVNLFKQKDTSKVAYHIIQCLKRKLLAFPEFKMYIHEYFTALNVSFQIFSVPYQIQTQTWQL